MLNSNLKITGTCSTLSVQTINSLDAVPPIVSYRSSGVNLGDGFTSIVVSGHRLISRKFLLHSAILVKSVLTFLCLGFLMARPAMAKNLLLVSSILEEGAVVHSGDDVKAVDRASYLPYDKRISVRPRSGLETLSAGRSLRFGSGTIFTVEEDRVVLHEGSLLYRSRKMESSLVVKSPEAEVTLGGMGTLMVQVEPNGGFRLVALLGRIRITDGKAKLATYLLPGELLFVKPGGLGFGDVVHVSLKKLSQTSFLISGFTNLSYFARSLAAVIKAQEDSIGKRFKAEVGEARGTDTFEVIPIKPDFENAGIGKPPIMKRPRQLPEKNIAPVSAGPTPSPSVYSVNSSNSPLEEFLGRSPKRLAGQRSTTVPVEISPPLRPSVSPGVIPAKVVFPAHRESVPPAVSTFRPIRPSIDSRELGNTRVRTLRRRQNGQSTFLFVSEDIAESKVSPAPSPEAVVPPVERNRLPGRLFDLP
jgi:hypothetical protein